MGLMTVKSQADVVGEPTESIAPPTLIEEFTTHGHGIDDLEQVGGGALPCVACSWWEGENSDDFASHGFKYSVHFISFFSLFSVFSVVVYRP